MDFTITITDGTDASVAYHTVDAFCDLVSVRDNMIVVRAIPGSERALRAALQSHADDFSFAPADSAGICEYAELLPC